MPITLNHLTLEEIGRRAGVSRSTVSRVINDQPNVSNKVRAKVLQVIEQTGYQPNMAARSLASQRSSIIGLVIPRSIHTLFTDPYFPRLTQGIAQACNRWDFTLALFILHNQDEERKLYPRISRPGFLDGLIVQATTRDDPLIPVLAGGKIPFVVAGRPEGLSEASFVDVDNVGGAYTAVMHLLQLGNRRIGTVTGALNTNAGRDRLQGYRNALVTRRIEFDESLVVEGDFTEMGGYYAALKLLPSRPEALFVASDMMALGVLRAARELGLTIPEDLALVSYDDLPPAQYASPHLTTIRQPVSEFGEKAVEILLDIIENGPLPPRRVIFNTELVIRDSCGAAQRHA